MTSLTQCAPQGNSQHTNSDHSGDHFIDALASGGRNHDATASGTHVTVIAEWLLNRRGELVRVLIDRFNGVWLVNIRKWYEAEDGAIRPGKQGIAFSVRHLPQLAEAVAKALSIARERGLIAIDGEAGK
jgi:hypothetical protein